MQTLLPAHDKIPLNASPQRDPIPTSTPTAQPESQPFSQIIEDQQQAKLNDLSAKTPVNRTSSTDHLRETQSKSRDRQKIDSPNRSENSGQTEKFADKLEGNSSASLDDAHLIEFKDSQAQDQAETAQSQPVKSAETNSGDAPVEPNKQPRIEDSNQGSNDFVIVQEPESFKQTQSSTEVIDESENPVNQTLQEPVFDPEIPVNNELQTSLPVEPTNAAGESVSVDRSSGAVTDHLVNTSVSVSNQNQASSQEAVADDNANINQAQGQLSQQSADSILSTSNQIGTQGSIDRQEPTAAQPEQHAQQDTSAQTNLRLEEQPVQSEPRSAAQSNSQANTQANTQTNQATQVTVGQDQQQSLAEDKPSDKGYSEPRTDELRIKSTSQQQAKSNLPPAQEEMPTRSAASARAAQIDTAIRVENATGQPVTVQVQATPAVQVAHGGASLTNGAEVQTLNLPDSRADSLQDPAQARILRGLTATLNQRGGSLSMRLDPPDLGQLRIQMSIVRGIVTANFQVQTPQAQALLERSLATLKSALQGQGLTVERLTVQTTPQQTNAQSARHESDQQASQQRQQHDAGQGESKGRRDEQSQDSMSHRSQFRAHEYAAFDLNPQPAGAD